MVRSSGAFAQALVESALVLPFVVTLSLGVLQVVLYVHARDVLVTSVQEGARLAAEDGRRWTKACHAPRAWYSRAWVTRSSRSISRRSRTIRW